MRKLFILLLIVLFIMAIVYNYGDSHHDNNEVVLSQAANSSSGLYWTYKLSSSEIISEKQYYESRFPLNFGPGYKQNWIFEVIGEGEVTINWIAYSGSSINPQKSYKTTYVFEYDGSYHVVSS